jgi:hypothetical protein
VRQCITAWGARVLHVWDRGFAGRAWLTQAREARVRFVLRWPKGYKLVDAAGRERQAWEIARGQRSWAHRMLWDARRHCSRKTGVVAFPVTHPTDPQPRWLVVARRGQGQEPWYLLTTERVEAVDDAWRIVLIYARHWQLGTTWRYRKSELAMESPRLWTWERREKLLLTLLAPDCAPIRQWLLRFWCHRTGKRSRETPTPLYCIRSALSRLWQDYRPSAPSSKIRDDSCIIGVFE